MAAGDSLRGKPATLECAVLSDGLNRVLRAGRIEPATAWEGRRNHQLVEANRQDEQLSKHGGSLAANPSLDN